MKEESKYKYVKRSQKDFSMSFKMNVVDEVEREGLNYAEAARRYGIQARSTVRTWME